MFRLGAVSSSRAGGAPSSRTRTHTANATLRASRVKSYTTDCSIVSTAAPSAITHGDQVTSANTGYTAYLDPGLGRTLVLSDLTTVTGSHLVSEFVAANGTLTKMNFTGDLTLDVNGVTLRACNFINPVTNLFNGNLTTGHLFDYCTINPTVTGSECIRFSGYTANRCNLQGCVDGVKANGGTTRLTECFVRTKSISSPTSSFSDGIQNTGGTGTITLTRCNVDVRPVLVVGRGDGTLADRALLLDRIDGFAGMQWTSADKAAALAAPLSIVTVAGDSSSTAGTLRKILNDRQTEYAANRSSWRWIIADPALAPSWNITLGTDFIVNCGRTIFDFRAAWPNFKPGGAPGVSSGSVMSQPPFNTPVGVVGKAFNIGGKNWDDVVSHGNTADPVHHVVWSGGGYDGYWGGNSGQTQDNCTVACFALGIYIEHFYATNPDHGNMDGLFDIYYGATDVTLAHMHYRHHYKAVLRYGTQDYGNSMPDWPVGLSVSNPGPYPIGVTAAPWNAKPIMRITEHDNFFDGIGTRSPLAKRGPTSSGFDVIVHCYNNTVRDGGFWRDSADGANEAFGPQNDRTLFPWETPATAVHGDFNLAPSNGVRTSGSQMISEASGMMWVDHCYGEAPSNSSGTAKAILTNTGGYIHQDSNVSANGGTFAGSTATFPYTIPYAWSPDTMTSAVADTVDLNSGPGISDTLPEAAFISSGMDGSGVLFCDLQDNLLAGGTQIVRFYNGELNPNYTYRAQGNKFVRGSGNPVDIASTPIHQLTWTGNSYSDTGEVIEAPVGPWTPLQLGGFLRQFYDVSGGVTGSVVTTDGTGITSVSDLSGQGRTLTPLTTGNGGQLLANALGSLSAIDLDGVDDALINAAAGAEVSATGTTNKNRTVIAFVKPDVINATSGSRNIAGYFNSADDDSRLRMSFNNATFNANRNPDNNTGGANTSAASGLVSDWMIAGLTQSSSLIHYLNGVGSAPLTPSGTCTFDRFCLGAKADIIPDGFLDGKVMFLVVADIELTTADRQRVEGWMAHKAARLDLLPVGHPYKTTPPDTALATGLLWTSDYDVATDLNQPWDATSVLSLWMGADRPNNPGAAGTLQTTRVLVTENVDLPGPSNAWKPLERGLRIQLAPYWTDPNQITGTGTGDVTTTSTGPSNRTEVYGRRTTGSLSGTPAEKWPDPASSVRWYGFSVYFAPDFPLDVGIDSNYWFDFIQWKGLNGGSPPFAMEVADGNKIRVGGTNFFHLPNSGNVATMTSGAWMRVVVGFYWSIYSDGWVEAWINGAQVLPRQTLPTMDTFVTKPDPVYLKQGIYRAGRWDRFETLYFSKTKIGADRLSVMSV